MHVAMLSNMVYVGYILGYIVLGVLISYNIPHLSQSRLNID